jgi:spore coat protein CotH
MPHNFYLYTDPASGRLTFISWDHNLVLGGATSGRRAVSFDKAEIGEDWPLIRFLLDDPVYRAAYASHLRDIGANVFDVAALDQRYDELAAAVAAHLHGAAAADVFNRAIETLRSITHARRDALAQFLATA